MSSLDLGVIGICAIASLIDRAGRHVWHGLILSAMRLSRSWEEGLWHAS